MSRFTWLLDPGHGGMIDGVYQTKGKRSPAFSDGVVLYEGELNRAITNNIIELAAATDIEVIDIVDSQEDVPLRERVRRANKLHKEKRNCIYVSIHANAYGNGSDFNDAKGASVFHHVRSSKGKVIAESLQDWIIKFTPFKDRGTKANESWANFYVLRKTHMPAVLSENGFMTNKRDATLLLSETIRKMIGAAHFAMIQEIEKNGF